MKVSNLAQAIYRARQAELKVKGLELELIEERKANARLIAELTALRIERRAA